MKAKMSNLSDRGRICRTREQCGPLAIPKCFSFPFTSGRTELPISRSRAPRLWDDVICRIACPGPELCLTGLRRMRTLPGLLATRGADGKSATHFETPLLPISCVSVIAADPGDRDVTWPILPGEDLLQCIILQIRAEVINCRTLFSGE